MDADKRRRLGAKTRDLAPAVHVGKAGLTDAVAAEVRRHLEGNELLKVRLLAASRAESDRKDIAERLAKATGSAVVEVRGFTVVLYRPKKRSTTRSADS